MSNTKTVMSQAANTQGLPLDITDVFSTYLYTGTGAALTINNGIDLAGEGGLVWLKNRNTASNHSLHDTERTPSYQLVSNSTAAEDTLYGDLTSFNSDGFSLGTSGGGNNIANTSAIASWTFRKAPKFFTCLTYTGNGASQNISHNLGCVPGMIIVKNTSDAANWAVWHRGNTSPEYQHLQINTTSAALTSGTVWNSTNPTDSEFSVGNYYNTNNSGSTYVAYLFAHNDGDGEFGPDGSDIIKCGSYTGNGSSNGPEINLGFEPQWVLIKESSNTGNWQLFDNMRGMVADGVDARIAPNLSSAEDSIQSLTPTATSFKINTTSGNMNTNGSDHIYMAIRRGPLSPPESATEVFDMDFLGATSPNPPAYNSSGWPVDMGIQGAVGAVNSNVTNARLIQGEFLKTDSTDAETASSQWVFDFQDGWRDSTAVSSSILGYMWRRAPNYFDVVAYSGNGTAGRTVSHNLGVAPEMIWTAKRSSSSGFKVLSPNQALLNLHAINSEYADSTTCQFYGDNSVVVSPTDTNFTVGTILNGNGSTFISYLFASLDGISKVGSYTGNGSSQTIDCGFTSGARFILIKRTDSTGDWYVWDTERGIVAGNDPHLSLNTTAAEVTSDDSVDPDNSGFIVNQVSATNINVSSASYIFYAIA